MCGLHKRNNQLECYANLSHPPLGFQVGGLFCVRTDMNFNLCFSRDHLLGLNRNNLGVLGSAASVVDSGESRAVPTDTFDNERTRAMSNERSACALACSEQLQQEFSHLKRDWSWLFMFGILLAVCGAAAVIFPALTVVTSFAAVMVLGVTLMIAGIATVITSFWVGKWSGMLVQFLVGLLYLVIGFMVTDKPLQSAAALTLFVAAFCIVAGLFRTVAALSIRYPHWGWSLLNGMITFLLGMVIYRQFPESAIWVLGLLVGLEMLFHGWTWIVISMAIKNMPEEAVQNVAYSYGGTVHETTPTGSGMGAQVGSRTSSSSPARTGAPPSVTGYMPEAHTTLNA
jgi:uncharacterized membrane protein HdeD (DUF308 family)